MTNEEKSLWQAVLQAHKEKRDPKAEWSVLADWLEENDQHSLSWACRWCGERGRSPYIYREWKKGESFEWHRAHWQWTASSPPAPAHVNHLESSLYEQLLLEIGAATPRYFRVFKSFHLAMKALAGALDRLWKLHNYLPEKPT